MHFNCCFIDICVEIEYLEEIDFEIVSSEDIEFELEDFIIGGGGGGKLPYYQGEYNPTPKIIPQTLYTKEKSMLKDVNIKAIPYSEVSNPEGGNTVIIGGEL